MLSPTQLRREGGGCHASATGATGPGDPGNKRPGDYHRARRRCGPTHRADGQDGLAGGRVIQFSNLIPMRVNARSGWAAKRRHAAAMLV